MPFDQLPARLGAIPAQQFQSQPAPPVYPIGDIIKNGVDNLNKILETFSPLDEEERKAKLAQAMYLKLAYEAGVKGDPTLLQQVMGHQKQTLSEHQIYLNNKAASEGRTAGAAKKPISNAAATAARAKSIQMKAAQDFKLLQQKQTPAVSDPNSTPPTDSPVSGGDVPQGGY